MSFLVFLAGEAAQPALEKRDYRCFDETTFTLVLSEGQAVVRFKNGEYRLPRKPSAIAVKYASAKATLYLDGDFAAFVADDRPLPGCTRVRASATP
ncbi:hypothetical protein [Sphingomonas alba]|uniref:C-type lysozyme inhibitor domain-containing protein n=1 Tax=Sphingomonas alba TaxID=2908208 RepID=A0ABT0RP84_9SPHN|nr:hypothetical protein [Sphingomonas alba]MCL6684438.1 hypothetical protein [Sphingomonas alba]